MTRRRLLTTHDALVVTPQWLPGTRSTFAPSIRLVRIDALEDFPWICLNLEDVGWVEEHITPGREAIWTLEYNPPRPYLLQPVLASGYGQNPFPFPGLREAAVAFSRRSRYFRWSDDLGRLTVTEPWDSSLSPWECRAMVETTPMPGSMGSELAKRWRWDHTRIVRAASAPWDRLRGLRAYGDPARFLDPQRQRTQLVEVFLGWPAFLAVAGAMAPGSACLACGALTKAGNDYCHSPECDRARATLRKREQRARTKSARETIRT